MQQWVNVYTINNNIYTLCGGSPMDRKIIILLSIIFVCLLLVGPVSAKEKVKIVITADNSYNIYGGYIDIKLVDSHGKAIKSNANIYYKITDSSGKYKWESKAYRELHLRYYPGTYDVIVEFKGDSKYSSASASKTVTVSGGDSFDPYTYYDDHNWGMDQKTDDYIEDNYWDEEIYDDPFTYDGEGP